MSFKKTESVFVHVLFWHTKMWIRKRTRRRFQRIVIVIIVTCICVISVKLSSVERKYSCPEEYRRIYYSVKDVINPHKVNLTLNEDHLCKHAHPYLLILIPSIPLNHQRRETIRKTWSSFTKDSKLQQILGQNVVLAFLLGSSNSPNDTHRVQQESRVNADIIQGDFVDSYENLTRKMLMGFKWMIDYCPGAKYIVKVDEDVYLNIPALVNVLQSDETIGVQDSPGLIYGYIHRGNGVRRSGSKWVMTCEQFPFDELRNYVEGNSYVISGKLVPELFRLSEYFPYVSIEDAYITGTLGYAAGAKLVYNKGFAKPTVDHSVSCDFYNKRKISRTKVDIPTMNLLWSIYENKTSCTLSVADRIRRFAYLTFGFE